MLGTISLDARKRFIVRSDFHAAPILQRVPDVRMWDAKAKVWIVSPSRINIEYLRQHAFEWSPEANSIADAVIARGVAPAKAATDDYVFAEPPPFGHQREGFARGRNADAFALLMEQRTGKTRVAIDAVSDRFLRSRIDTAVVFCPNTVKSVWLEQIAQWTPRHVPYTVLVYSANDKKNFLKAVREASPHKLLWLIFNVDVLSIDRKGGGKVEPQGASWVAQLLAGRRVFGLLDEATRFKNHSASRTKHLLKLIKPLCAVRWFLTGTLITQSPLDAFSPFNWLDLSILGYSSFYAFRNSMCLMGGYGNRQIMGYMPGAVEGLAKRIAPFSYRVTRDQCFDTPPKIYAKREIELSDEQRRVYNQMRDTMRAELDAVGKASATIVLTQLMRLQQITGGFLPFKDEDDNTRIVAIPGPNPRMNALLEELEETEGKVIIWARFRPEIALITAKLREGYSDEAVVEMHGGIKEHDRTTARVRFQTDPTCRFFVGQQQTGGLGLDLSAARQLIYYSNTFSLEDRLQSEDRGQGPNQQHALGVLDIVAKDTRDSALLSALRSKKNLADVVNGDNWREWI